ncbi:hypothetical protein FACS189452_06090 [Bacteroidia bacterium]|nr:hypothetical protein FACS189452_06090 [Bacteroidia bacterium]GHT82636.1 hypothetical protein FACS189467_8000 [Bacteroidia bacterium]
MALAIGFAGCKDDAPAPNVDDLVEDGFYVVGEATAYADLATSGANKTIMAVGFNEADDQKVRDGMYEKYIALEGGKPFSLVLKAGAKETQYGAALEATDTLSGGDEPRIKVYKGTLTENATLQVPTSGLYHIVLDLNLDNKLSQKLILIAPVEWGVRGGFVSSTWDFRAFPAPTFSKTSMTYTLTDQTVESAGGWKFAYGGGWKIFLDDDGFVKANTNLGNNATDQGPLQGSNLKQGGKDIDIARGFYTITLTWNLAQGDVKNSFTAGLTKTGNAAVVDYTNCELELVGSGVDSLNVDIGAKLDATSSWNWGYTLSAGKPTVNGTVYTWTWTSVTLKADGFKVRTIDAQASGGVAGFDVGNSIVDASASSSEVVFDGGDIKVSTAGNYSIVMTINATEDTRKIVITKL